MIGVSLKTLLAFHFFSCIREWFMKDALLEDDYKAASVLEILASILFQKELLCFRKHKMLEFCNL